MGILTWIVFGLIAGWLAQYIMPDRGSGGLIVTVLLGIAGAVIGGMVAAQLGFGDISGFDVRSILIAVGGALLLLLGYRLVKRAL